MKDFKKITAFILCFALAVSLAACGKETGSAEKEESGKLSIVCTVFPIYDWVKNILGEKIDGVNLTLLLKSGTDLHNYQPTVDDLSAIAECDMFIYIGGVSDKWVDDALRSTSNSSVITMNLIELLGGSAKEEEIVEGMEEEDEEEEGAVYDEHIWLSVKNAGVIVEKIAEELSRADSENSAYYSETSKAYLAKLDEIDAQFRAAVDSGTVGTVVFADRFPFRYLIDDYGLEYYAAFPGCSAETEASFETITFLARKVDELKLKSVLTIEGSSNSIARTVIENTAAGNQQILKMNSMQSVTSAEIEKGADYLRIMEENAAVLKKALA